MKRPFLRSACFVLVCLTCVASWPQPASAGQLQSVSPRGVQRGATTTITLRGQQIGEDVEIMLPFAAEAQRVSRNGRGTQAVFEVTLPDDLSPGFYPLRFVDGNGASNAVYVSVDSLPNHVLADAKVFGLPFAVTGAIRGDAIATTVFNGAAGQKITVEIEAQRLGSRLKPVIELLRPDGNILSVAHGTPRLGGDARLLVELPSDGEYSVRVHDALYRGGRPGFYRLKVGDILFAEAAVPSAIAVGDAPPVDLVTGSDAATSISVTPQTISGIYAAEWRQLPMASGRAPKLFIREEPVLTEVEATEHMAQGESGNPLGNPIGINGRLQAAGEVDEYHFAVTPGVKMRYEIIAERAGLPLDSMLSLHAPDGRTLAAGDDFSTTRDSRVDFAAPADVNEVVVKVSDRLGRGGDDFAYSLFVTTTDRPDFSLDLGTAEINIPRGGTAVMPVKVNRNGYGGPVELRFARPLPTGISVSGHVIPASADQALVTLKAADHANVQISLEMIGRGIAGDHVLQRYAARPIAGDPIATHSPWLARELAVATMSPRSLGIAWDLSAADGAPTEREVEPAPGETVTAKVALSRRDEAQGDVRLRLLTSQIVPVFESGPNAGKPQQAKAIRLAEPVTFTGEVTEATAAILFPNDLPLGTYDVALVAELLSSDGSAVVDRTVTPASRIAVVGPSFEIAVAEDIANDALTAVVGLGEAAKIKGKIIRSGKFDGPVSLTLAGLPEGWAPPEIQIPADAVEFEFPLNLPFGGNAIPAGNMTARLTGMAAHNDVEFSSKSEIPITLQVQTGSVPNLLPLFEDERNFARRLPEGGGQVAMNLLDRYSGAHAIRVTPDQRYATNLAGLNVAIKEHPEAGEYRFLRFAWKKTTGANVMLQLHANGNWGPLLGQAGPEYRYLAGTPRNDVAARVIGDGLPSEWTVVTRDLFADFGEFQLDGLALTPGDGEFALFDHIYLARTADDLSDCPESIAVETPKMIFEDDARFVDALSYGNGQAEIVSESPSSGEAAIKITPDQRYNENLPGLGVKVRQNPGEGEFRFVRFAWKKQGGQSICLQLNHDGQWGPDTAGHKFRYHAGPGPECYGASMKLANALPADWVVITRDLYADFGEFTLQGIALSPVDGEFGMFDQIYLGRSPRDFELIEQE